MNKSSRNTYDTLSPLTWLLKIFAINCNVEEESYPKKLYLIKVMLIVGIVGCLNACCLYYKVYYVFNIVGSSVKLTDSIQMIYDHFQFIVDLWFIYKYGRHMSVEYFKQYETIDNILCVTDYSTIKWKLARLLCLFVTIWLTSSAFDFGAWYLGFGLLTPLIYSIAYFYLFIKIITTLDLTSHIMHIEMRLTMMANLVQRYYAVSENLPGFVRDTISKKIWRNTRDLELTTSAIKIISSKEDFDEDKLLTRCYLLLTDQVEFINSMFGIRILLNSLSLLIDIVRFTNLAVRLIMSTQVTTYNDAGYWPAVSSILRMLTCAAVLVSLVCHCERTYYQSDRIISIIDHLLVNKNPNEKVRSTMIELRALVLARPISFKMDKFFRIDCSFLVSVASATVTYTIILLQSMN